VKALTIRGDIALSSYSQFSEGFNNKGGDIAPSSVTLKIYSDSQAIKNFLDRRGGGHGFESHQRPPLFP